MKCADSLTPERLREVLHYDPATGVFTRLTRAARRVHVGDVAGSINGDGYLLINIDGRGYKAHRLAWLYIHGVWPKADIDHINSARADNRFVNLREATRSLNCQNQKRAQRHNKLGILGVSRNAGKFMATIRINGRKKNLGRFPTPELAYAAYLSAKRLHHEGCTI